MVILRSPRSKSRSFWGQIQSFWNFWIFSWRVSTQRGFLKFEFWFSGLVNVWNLAHWNHRRRNPIFDHEKPFLTIKRALLTNFEPFSNRQVSSVCHFRLWSSDSEWFKSNPNSESKNQNSPKSKLIRFSTHLSQINKRPFPYNDDLPPYAVFGCILSLVGLK